ncbi:11881_t:CDS:2 [Ambispora gerdemannii]|uniref:Phosphotransferase n=1 Tax=Ambispora gerdemannii TaxID=144530 RepID=A0A9N9DHX3_9GLOM|nr:11881_t:CDS:2 [Ambispora gerdemannii]
MSNLKIALAELENQLILSQSKLESITDSFFSCFLKGLTTKATQNEESNEHEELMTQVMLPSFVSRLPTGNETGTSYAMDIGGTNLRVAAVTFLGEGRTEIRQKHFIIAEELKTSGVEQLFQWVAEKVEESIVEDGILKMGVTFSFPIEQQTIKKGVAMKMGKGFNVPGLSGYDVTELLNSSFKKKNLNIEIVAIVNDTVGTLVAQAYKDPNTKISLIFGTGTNAACVVPVDAITKLDSTTKRDKKGDDDDTVMLINTEWSLLGHDFLPFTQYDYTLDAQSDKPNFQPYEKMMSAHYFKELIRLVLLDYIRKFGLFGGKEVESLSHPYSLKPELLSRIQSEKDTNKVATILHDELKFSQQQLENPDDIIALQKIIHYFATRGSQLSASGIAALLKLLYGDYSNIKSNVTLAVDGSFYLKYREFSDGIDNYLFSILGNNTRNYVKLVSAENGGSIGAAMVAMLYSK